MTSSATKPVILYIFDPLCGWCYGFSPVVRKLHEEFADRFQFEVWSGGMVTGSRVGPMGDMKDYILSAIPRLEATTGVIVGEDYKQRLTEGSTISNSEPPSRALTILKESQPDKQVYFASAIQQRIFSQGKDANLPESYLDLAIEAGLGTEEFLGLWNHPESIDRTQEEFQQAAQLGVRGFPSLLLYHNQALSQLAYGYRSFDSIKAMLDPITAPTAS